MNSCVKVSFFDSENKIVSETYFDVSETNSCVEIKIPASSTSIHIAVSIIVLNVNTCVKIKIFNHTNELIICNYFDLNEHSPIYQNFAIPRNSMTAIICCISNYKPCDYCCV